MRRSRPRFPPWRQTRPQYQQPYRPPSSQNHHHNQQQTNQITDVFDFLNIPDSALSVKQTLEDPILTPLIMNRNQQLTPLPADSFALMGFVTRVRQKLEALVLSPTSFTACQINEVRDVGSHKHNTIIIPLADSQHPLTSDLVVVLKTLPTREAIEQLGNRLKQDFQNETSENNISNNLSLQLTDYGLLLHNDAMAVHLLVTTVPANWHSLDASIHLDRSICKRNFNAIKHAKWVDEVCIHPSNKVLVRLLKDLRQRFPGLQALNPWLINLLAHHCVTNTNNPNEQLSPSYAFKRALQLLSSGLFLPGSNGLHDPFNDSNINSNRAQLAMTMEEQDRLCLTSQTLLRALAIHPEYVLGLEQGPDIFAGPCELNGIQFEPSEPVAFDNESNDHALDENQQQPMTVEVNT